MTKTESRYMSIVAGLNCACCGTYGVQLHHIRETLGRGEKAGNFCIIPLCPDCHTGPKGIHGDKTFMRIHKLSELDMLNSTVEAVFRAIL